MFSSELGVDLYLLPFKILMEKIPFIEYLSRAVKFLWNPNVETEPEFTNGDMRYSLWDIVSVTSLFTVVTGLVNLVDQENYGNALSLFSNQFTFYFQFGYYAFWSTLMFFILTSVALLMRSWKLRLKEAFFCSLQYARFYALFLLLFFPLIAWYINYLLYEVSNMNEYVGKNPIKSFSVFVAFIYLYVRCCLNPISSFSSFHRSRKITMPIFFIISLSAFTLNMYAPSIGKLGFDNKKACKIMLLNSKFKDAHIAVKNRMQNMCETKT
ncbi:MAG: hypothetical protein ACI9J4_000002 [Paraglaciecola sp.]|jgi:hypothetical protein